MRWFADAGETGRASDEMRDENHDTRTVLCSRIIELASGFGLFGATIIGGQMVASCAGWMEYM
jgi:hypothetical protein